MIKFVIQFDGVIIDAGDALYAAHVVATSAVGWSRMDPQRFRQLLRTKGSRANFLPGAKPLKSNEYQAEFERQRDDLQVIEKYKPVAGLMESMRRLRRAGSVSFVTLGTNVDARRNVLLRIISTGDGDRQQELELSSLNSDPRRRPGELAALAGDPRRTVVVASSDSLIRSAGAADLVSVGVAGGDCSVKRLQQAGADLSYRTLSDLTDDLADGGADLARVGLFLGATG